MNGHVTALQHLRVAAAVVGVLLSAVAGSPSAQARTAQGRGGDRVAHASIVDGAPASISEFPFQVALYDPRLGSPAKGFFCGGVIIGATRVATAAHCLLGEHGQRTAPAEIAVLAGSSDLEPPDPGSVIDPVAQATVDPAYNSLSSDYDVGLLRLARPLWSGAAPALDGHDAIAPLAPDLPLANSRSDAALAGQASTPVQATVSGWGDLNAEPGPSPNYPERLRAARVPLVATAYCEEAYTTIEQSITPRMLCAGARTDSCYGDSGGPLVESEPGANGPGDDVLLGLVDFGDGCAQPGYPGVYVKIADPAIAAFLDAGAAQASSLPARRSVCLRQAKRGHRGRRASRHHRGRRRCKR
ncbi:MAG TPA: serine protease [Solirubrobacteraceae bacterium]|jgi:trypsin|nr:serine protease [Solirubrobacteraceae bacterium]